MFHLKPFWGYLVSVTGAVKQLHLLQFWIGKRKLIVWLTGTDDLAEQIGAEVNPVAAMACQNNEPSIPELLMTYSNCFCFTRRLAESEQLFPDTPVQFVTVEATTRQEHPNPCSPLLREPRVAEMSAQKAKKAMLDFLENAKSIIDYF